MDGPLGDILGSLEAGPGEDAEWGDIRLRITAWLGDTPVPNELVTSVRAVVLRGDSVLVAEDATGDRHIVPGGRLEPGEMAETALAREVAEETGWLIGAATPVGLLHYRHLTPKPAGYPYPWPDFLQRIFAAEVERFAPELRLSDDYVVGASFVPLVEVPGLGLTAKERSLLDAAIRALRRPG